MPAPHGRREHPVDSLRAVLRAMTQHAQSIDGNDGDAEASHPAGMSLRSVGFQSGMDGGPAVLAREGKPRKRFPKRRRAVRSRRLQAAGVGARPPTSDWSRVRFPQAVVLAGSSRGSRFIGALRLLVNPVAFFVTWWLVTHFAAMVLAPGLHVMADLIGLWLAVTATILANGMLTAVAKALPGKRRDGSR